MFQIPDDSAARHVRISYLDARGNQAVVDGVPVWESSGGLLNVVPDADGLGATITPNGPVGSGQLSVTADADLGSGVSQLVTLEDFTIVAGRAVSGQILLDPAP
jgi:hypothetical protein